MSTSLPAASGSKFQKNYYDTIESGRQLNPLDHPFADQSEISLHLQALASLNRRKFKKIKIILSFEQAQFKHFETCLKAIQEQFQICSRQWSKMSCLNFWPDEDSGNPMYTSTQRATIEQNYKFCIEHWKLANDVLKYKCDPALADEHEFAVLVMATHATNHETIISTMESFLEVAQDMNSDKPKVIDGKFLARYRDYGVQWGKTADVLTELNVRYRTMLNDSYKKIGETRKRLGALRFEKKRCIAASEFSQSLSMLQGPFEFLRLPREIRNMVWRELLFFDYNITLTEIIRVSPQDRNPRSRTMYTKLWTTPVFQTSSCMRREAIEEFCRLNTFVCRSFNTLATDIGYGVSSFAKSIRNLTITWSTLGSSSVVIAKVLRSLKGLECLNIYVNLDILGGIPGCAVNNMGGLNAFRSIIDLPNPKLPNLKRVEIVNITPMGDQESQCAQLISALQWQTAHIILPNIYPNQQTDFRYYQRHIRVRQIEGLRAAIKNFDTMFSHRVLGAKSPATTYANGRQPYRPSNLWPKLNAIRARRNEKHNRPLDLVAAVLKPNEVQSSLVDFENGIREARKTLVFDIKRNYAEQLHRLAFFSDLPYHTYFEDYQL